MTSLRRTGTLFLASILIVCTHAGAQDRRHVADTVVSDTVVEGAEDAGGMKVDTTRSYDTGVDSSLSSAGAGGSIPANDLLQPRIVPDSVVQDWKKSPDFAYANDPRYWKRERQEENTSADWFGRVLSSATFRYGVYIILAALLIYAIGRIVTENQLGIFYRGAKRSAGSAAGAGEGPAEEEDIDRRLQESMDNKDYRQAVRYSFLRTLRRLDERGLIRGHGQATNQEYLRQLGGTVQEAPFRFLTNAYEKVWYGEFGLNEETFRRLIGYFAEFDKTISG